MKLAYLLDIIKVIVEIGLELGKLGMDAEQTKNKFNSIFGEMSAKTEEWSNNFAEENGFSRTQMLEFLATIQKTLVPMGMSRDEAANMSKEIVSLAADLASFNDVPTEQVINDIQSALTGNTQSMIKYGVEINENRLKHFALSQEMIREGQELIQLQKVRASYLVMLDDTKEAEGNLAETNDSAIGQFRRMNGLFGDIGDSLGTLFLPGFNKSLNGFNNVLSGVRNITDELTEQKKTMAELAEEYITLTNKENLSTKEKSRLVEISKDLREILLEVADGIDEETGKLKINDEELIKKSRKKDIQAKKLNVEKKLEENKNDTNVLKDRLNEVESYDLTALDTRLKKDASVYYENVKKVFIELLSFSTEEFDSLIKQVGLKDPGEFSLNALNALGKIEKVQKAFASNEANFKEVFKIEYDQLYSLDQEKRDFSEQIVKLNDRISELNKKREELQAQNQNYNNFLNDNISWEKLEETEAEKKSNGNPQSLKDGTQSEKEQGFQTTLGAGVKVEYEEGTISTENYRKQLNDTLARIQAEKEQAEQEFQTTLEAGVKFEYEEGTISTENYRKYLEEKLQLLTDEGLKYSSQWKSVHADLAALDQKELERKENAEKKLNDTLARIQAEKEQAEQEFQTRLEAGVKFEYEQGTISTANYRKYLEEKLQLLTDEGLKYSSQWESLHADLAALDQKELEQKENAEKKLNDTLARIQAEKEQAEQEFQARLEAGIKFEYEQGVVSTENYLKFLKEKLEGTKKYSEEYFALNKEINDIEKQIPNSLLDHLNIFWDKIKDTPFGKVLLSLAEGITNAISSVKDSAGNQIEHTDVIGQIASGNWQGALSTMFNKVVSESESFADAIKMLSDIIGDILKSLGPSFDILFEAIQPLIPVIGDLITLITGPLKLLLKLLESVIIRPLVFLMDKIVRPVIEGLIGLWNSIIDGLVSINILGFRPFGFLKGMKVDTSSDDSSTVPDQEPDPVKVTGSQISNLTGASRDLFADLLRPLRALTSMNVYLESINRHVEDIVGLKHSNQLTPALSDNSSGNWTIQQMTNYLTLPNKATGENLLKQLGEEAKKVIAIRGIKQ